MVPETPHIKTPPEFIHPNVGMYIEKLIPANAPINPPIIPPKTVAPK